MKSKTLYEIFPIVGQIFMRKSANYNSGSGKDSFKEDALSSGRGELSGRGQSLGGSSFKKYGSGAKYVDEKGVL